jgi:uncharacterized protein
MLTNTFCHLPGIGEKTERALWAAGVTCWADALPGNGPVPGSWRAAWDDGLHESVRQHAARNVAWFARALPPREHWRLYRDYHGACAFLDIETTGLGPGCEVTTVALSDGATVRHYVRGRNLDDFPRDVRDYPLLVTYNGKSFDVPILEAAFGIRLPGAHVDLRHVLRSLGITGGPKGCERRLGLSRPDGLEDVDGSVAVLLWEEYRRGDARALEALLAYNVQDVLSLQTLVVLAHNLKVARTPFAGSLSLPPPPVPPNPFRADRGLVERVVRDRMHELVPFLHRFHG